MFSDFAIWYLFLAGTAAGSFVWATVMDVRENEAWDARRVSLRSRSGFYGCAGLIALAALLLFFDLGNPYDIAYLFENPFRSIMSIGAWLVALCLMVSALVVVMLLTGIDRPYLFRGLETAGSALSIGVMTYTGVLLSSMTSVDFWHTPWLVALFVASALGCGCALIEALAFSLSGGVRAIHGLDRLSRVVRVVEFAALLAFLATRWIASEAACESCKLLLFGQLSGLFWGGLILFAFAIPLAARIGTRLTRVPASRLIGAASTLVGGVCLRYCVVLAASYSAIGFAVT